MNNTVLKTETGFKVLPTGVKTYSKVKNGVKRIEVIEPTEVKARLITKQEFKQVMAMIETLPISKVSHLDMSFKGISFVIDKRKEKLHFENLLINHDEVRLTPKQFKTIHKTLNND